MLTSEIYSCLLICMRMHIKRLAHGLYGPGYVYLKFAGVPDQPLCMHVHVDNIISGACAIGNTESPGAQCASNGRRQRRRSPQAGHRPDLLISFRRAGAA